MVVCLPDSNPTICTQDLLGHVKDFKCYGGENDVNVIFSEHCMKIKSNRESF